MGASPEQGADTGPGLGSVILCQKSSGTKKKKSVSPIFSGLNQQGDDASEKNGPLVKRPKVGGRKIFWSLKPKAGLICNNKAKKNRTGDKSKQGEKMVNPYLVRRAGVTAKSCKPRTMAIWGSKRFRVTRSVEPKR